MELNNEPKKYEIKENSVLVDIKEVKEFVEKKLTAFLLDNLDFPEAAFILQTLLREIEDIEKELN